MSSCPKDFRSSNYDPPDQERRDSSLRILLVLTLPSPLDPSLMGPSGGPDRDPVTTNSDLLSPMTSHLFADLPGPDRVKSFPQPTGGTRGCMTRGIGVSHYIIPVIPRTHDTHV